MFKGIDGALELLAGILLLALSPQSITGMLLFFVRKELTEDPTDAVVNWLLRVTESLTHTRMLASVYLIVHGVAKVLLVGGMVTKRMWAYPAALLVFATFVAYQLYQLSTRRSVLLWVLTAMDLIVVALIANEYARVRKETMVKHPLAY